MLPEYLLLPFGTLFTVLTVVGVLGNLIVIIAIASDHKMRKSVMNILLLNLAVADMSNLIVAMSEWVPTIAQGELNWIFPEFMCGFFRYIEYIFIFASISTQVIVCIERYIAIVHPMRARLLCNRRNAILAIIVAWIFIGTFAFPYAAYNAVLHFQRRNVCSNTVQMEPWWMYYKQAEFLTFYFIPCLLIIAMYTRIAHVLWAQNPHLSESVKCLNDQRKKDAISTRRTVVKMLVACVTVYFVCYSPIQAVFLSKTIFDTSFNISFEIVLIFNALAMTCSASNPLLYTLFSTKFRRKLRDLITCRRYSLGYRSTIRDTRFFISNIHSTDGSHRLN